MGCAQNEITYYAPLFGKMTVDTTEWSLPREEPYALYFYLRPADYNRNYGNLKHKSSGLAVFFRNEYTYENEDFTSDFLSRMLNGNVSEKRFHEKFKTYTYSWRNELALAAEVDKGIYFVVSTNARLMDSLQVKALEKLMSSFSLIQPSEIDNAMGYPLNGTNEEKAFRSKIVNEIIGKQLVLPGVTHYDYLKANPLDTVWFDEYYFLEKKYNFSYQRVYETRRHDINRDFNADEYLNMLFGNLREDPCSISKMPRFIGEIRSQERFITTKYLAEDYSKAVKSPVIYNEIFRDIDGYILLSNDSAWNLLYAEKGKDKTGTMKWLTYNHTGTRGYTSGKGAKSQLLNSGYYESVSFGVPDDGIENYVITSYPNKRNEAGLRCQAIPNVSVINSKHKKEKLTKFTTPTNIGNYKIIMLSGFESGEFYSLGDQGFDYDHADWGHYYSDSVGLVSRKLLFTSNIVSKEYMSIYQIENKIATYPMNQRLVISPVIEADLDSDGNREVFRVFVSNGSVINYEIFENSKAGLVKVELTDGWKKNIKKHHFVSKLIHVSKERNFYSPYEELRVETVAEAGDYWWDGGIEAEPVYVVEEPREEEVLTFASEMPVYPGGTDALMKDLNANLIYPDMEKENEIQGTVYMGFVVEKDGSITNVQVKRGVNGGPGLTKAAETAVKKLKKFETPAKNNGKPVRYQYTLPVKFKLD